MGLEYDPALVYQTPLGFREGADALKLLVERRPDIEAVFFSAELWAVGALLECQRLGWDVPEKIAIVGYDDSRLAPEVFPVLTAARVPRIEIGRMAAEMLIRRIRGERVSPPVVDMGFRLIEGASA